MSTAPSPSRPHDLKLPEPRLLQLEGKCVIEYIDTSPDSFVTSKDMPAIVLAHGFPGTCKDFRHLVPLLRDNVRVIGINLPGVGGSKVLDRDNCYEYIGALEAAKLAYEALTSLCSATDLIFFLGHSFGGHTAINLATLAVENNHFMVGGMILLASAGHRPHRAVWSVANAAMARTVSAEVPIISAAAKTVTKLGYTQVIGFPDNAPRSHYVSTLIRTYRTDFNVIEKQIKALAVRKAPAFVAWTKDDLFVEEAIFRKLSQECHAGPRIVFEKGGHNIQKMQARVLAKEIAAWTQQFVLAPGHYARL
ncbi:Serine protease family s33, partial [Globisporangium splendens]